MKEPTSEEVRAYRISLGYETLMKIRRIFICPGCGKPHTVMGVYIQQLEQGYEALLDDAHASRDVVRELRKHLNGLESALNKECEDMEKHP